MELKQKKFSNATTFSFKDDSLTYTIKDSSGSRTFSVDYDSLSTETQELEERNQWFRNAGILWVLLGIVYGFYTYSSNGRVGGQLWTILGVICLAVYKFVKTSYTVIPSDRGSIFVIRSTNHDEIVGELFERRKGQLREQYADVNYENDPDREIGKFKWLMDEGVISDTEYNEALSKITNDISSEVEADEKLLVN